MSTSSLVAFLEDFKKDLDGTSADAKRLEYNLQTHRFTYQEGIFLAEMLADLKSRKIVMTQKRKAEVTRLASLFSADLYNFFVKLNASAPDAKGFVRFTGSSKSFAFLFTTDVRTGKPPNTWKSVQGQADVFDKIKVSYSAAYLKFFYGVRKLFEGSKAEQQFNDSYKTKGQMGQSGHAEGKGIIESMTREFFDNHAHKVYSKCCNNTAIGEDALIADLASLGVDLEFMRDTKGMIQEISLIGAAANNRAGAKVKADFKAAKTRLEELLNNPSIIEEMADLQGSDSFTTIKKKEILEKTTKAFKKSKNAKVKTDSTKVRHSKKTVSSKSKSRAKKAASSKSSPNLKGVVGLKAARTTKSKFSNLTDIAAKLNKGLPERVRANMQEPGLVNRTGVFSESVRVVDAQRTPKGFPSIGYTYDAEPYGVFEMGRGTPPWATPERDPRKVIEQSIREVATELAIGRFYLRRL